MKSVKLLAVILNQARIKLFLSNNLATYIPKFIYYALQLGIHKLLRCTKIKLSLCKIYIDDDDNKFATSK